MANLPTLKIIKEDYEALAWQKAERRGVAFRVCRSVYVALPEGINEDQVYDFVAEVCRSQWETLVGHLFPGGVISHLSAFMGGRITPQGEVTLTLPDRYRAGETTALPGVSFVTMKGTTRKVGRDSFNRENFISSPMRTLLEI